MAEHDESMVKIIQTLGLDYGPAIKSTKLFEAQIESLNKQLFQLKANAIQGAREINQSFASQLGSLGGGRTILDQWGQPLKTIQTEASKIGNEISNNFETASSAAQKHGQSVQDVAKKYSTFASEWQRRSSWFLSEQLFRGTINAAKETVQSIAEVETAIMQIGRVMEDQAFNPKEFRDELLRTAREYGQEFDVASDVALRFAQASYSVKDTLDLTKTALLAVNSAELDAKNATESMIGIMAQWNLTANELPLVLDKINKVGDDFTVTSQDLVDGLLRSSGAAKVMGMSLEDTIATLTVMREASGRTGREVGNALNSILSYIQRPKSIDVFESLGIKMFVDEARTQFRPVMQIFQELSQKWNTASAEIKDAFVAAAEEAGLFSEELAIAMDSQEEYADMVKNVAAETEKFTDVQKRDTAQAAAGVYRRNYLIGLLERFARTQDVLISMNEAEGYSMRENARYMETLEAKYNQLKVSAMELSVAIGDAGLLDALKGIVDGTSNAIQAFNNLDQSLQTLIITAGELLALAGAIKNIGSLFGINVTLSSSIQFFSKLIPGWGKLIPLILTAASAIGLYAYNQHSATKQETEDILNKIQARQNEISQIESLKSQYEQLATSGNITEESKKALFDIQKQLVDSYGIETGAIDLVNGKYGDQIKIIDNLIQSKKDLNAVELEAQRLTAIDFLNTEGTTKIGLKGITNLSYETETNKILERVRSLAKEVGAIAGFNWAGVGNVIEFKGNPEEKLKVLTEYYKKLKEIEREIDDDEYGTFKNLLSDVSTEIANLNREVTNHKNILEQYNRLNFNETLGETINKVKELQSSMKDSKDIDSVNQKLEQYKQELINSADAQGKLTEWLPYINELFNETADSSNSVTDSINKQTNSIVESIKNINKLADTLGPVNEALYKMQKGQNLTTEEALNLLEAHSELLPYLEQTENGYKINATALENLKQKLIDNEITTLNSQANSTRATIEQTAQRIGAYNLEIEAISNLQTAQREAAKLRLGQSDVGIGSLTYEQYKATMAASGLELDYKSADEFEKAKAEQQNLYKQIIDYGELLERNEKLIEILNSRTFGVGKSTFNDINKNKDKEANKALDNYIKRLNFKKNMDELSIEDEIAGYQYAYDYLAKTEDEKMDLMVKIHNAQKKLQEDLFNNQLKLINRKVKLGEWSTEQEINELRWTLQAFAFTAEQKEQIIERIYDKEKQLQKERLADSKKWIAEQKEFDLLTIEEEIAAWERVKVNQIDNIEAVKEAEKNLHQLRKKQNEEFINLTEKTYEHWAKVGVYTIEQQIEKLKELHKHKQYDAYEEMKHIETLQDLYKELIEERLDGIKEAAEASIQAIEDEYEARIKAENDLIDELDKRQKNLKRLREDEDYEKKRKELLEKRRYHELRTGEEHTKAIIDIDKELAELEEEINRTKEDRKLEDEKQAAQDRIDNLENERDEKIKIINKELKKIEELFDENKIDLIALAMATSNGMFEEYDKNFFQKMKQAMQDLNFESTKIGKNKTISLPDVADIISDTESAIDNSKPDMKAIRSLFNEITWLKGEWAKASSEEERNRIASDAQVYYRQLEALPGGSAYADMLRRMSYDDAFKYLKNQNNWNYPIAHTGGLSADYGYYYLKPGELIVRSDLTSGLEKLLSAFNRKSTSSTMMDNSKHTSIGTLLNVEHMHMEDDIDGDILSRQLQRTILAIR